MKDILKTLRENWPILTFLVAMVVWYANTNSRITAVEAKVDENTTVIVQIADMKTDIEVIKANVTFIKERLD